MPDYKSKKIKLTNDIYDVLIVGGGITGISTALQLQKRGKKCILAEAQTIGFGTTGGSTAHLNTMMDTPYNLLEKNFNEDNAQLILQAAKKSISLIKKNIKDYNIECEFSQKKGYLFSQDDKQSKELKDILEGSKKAGCKVNYTNKIPVPIEFKRAIVFQGQAQLNPAKYIYGLAKAFETEDGI